MQEFVGPVKTTNQFVPPSQFDQQNRFNVKTNQFGDNQQQRFNAQQQAEVITLAPELNGNNGNNDLPEIITTTPRSNDMFNGQQQQQQGQFGGSQGQQGQFGSQNQFGQRVQQFVGGQQQGREQFEQNRFPQFPQFSTTTPRMQEFVRVGQFGTEQQQNQQQMDGQFQNGQSTQMFGAQQQQTQFGTVGNVVPNTGSSSKLILYDTFILNAIHGRKFGTLPFSHTHTYILD